MEDELEAFLADYYKRILPLAETLAKLRHACESASGEFASAYKEAGKINTADDAFIDQHAKHLYRKLLKAYHPDACTAAEQSSEVHSIITAYEEKSMGTLWRLDIERECCFIDEAPALIEYLEKQVAAISTMLDTMRLRRKAFISSAKWQLKERVFDAQLQGIDLIEPIARRLELQIAASQQILGQTSKELV